MRTPASGRSREPRHRPPMPSSAALVVIERLDEAFPDGTRRRGTASCSPRPPTSCSAGWTGLRCIRPSASLPISRVPRPHSSRRPGRAGVPGHASSWWRWPRAPAERGNSVSPAGGVPATVTGRALRRLRADGGHVSTAGPRDPAGAGQRVPRGRPARRRVRVPRIVPVRPRRTGKRCPSNSGRLGCEPTTRPARPAPSRRRHA